MALYKLNIYTLHYSCKLYSDKVNFGLLGDASPVSSLPLPTPSTQRSQLMTEFMKSKRPQKVHIQLPTTTSSSASSSATSGSGSNILYLIPPKLCQEAVSPDYLALCLSPPIDTTTTTATTSTTSSGGIKTIDMYLEPLSLPTNNNEYTSYILSTYEKKVSILY